MKNWKKLTAAALAALALVGSLAGCGNNADKNTNSFKKRRDYYESSEY